MKKDINLMLTQVLLGALLVVAVVSDAAAQPSETERLRVSRTELTNGIRYDLLWTNQDGERVIWTRTVADLNGQRVWAGVNLVAYDIKDGRLFGFAAQNDFQITVLQSDDVRNGVKAIDMGDPGWLAGLRPGWTVVAELPNRIVLRATATGSTLGYSFEGGKVRSDTGRIIDPNPVVAGNNPPSALSSQDSPTKGRATEPFLATPDMRNAPSVPAPPPVVAAEASTSFRSWMIAATVIAGVLVALVARSRRKSG